MYLRPQTGVKAGNRNKKSSVWSPLDCHGNTYFTYQNVTAGDNRNIDTRKSSRTKKALGWLCVTYSEIIRVDVHKIPHTIVTDLDRAGELLHQLDSPQVDGCVRSNRSIRVRKHSAVPWKGSVNTRYKKPKSIDLWVPTSSLRVDTIK